MSQMCRKDGLWMKDVAVFHGENAVSTPVSIADQDLEDITGALLGVRGGESFSRPTG